MFFGIELSSELHAVDCREGLAGSCRDAPKMLAGAVTRSASRAPARSLLAATKSTAANSPAALLLSSELGAGPELLATVSAGASTGERIQVV